MDATERSRSVWKDDVNLEAPPLEGDATADVCIVGAGIAGLTSAYLLQQSGAKVIVLERGSIGGGETAQTTAHLASVMDDRFEELERLFGQEGARLAYESHAAAIDKIEEITRAEGIDCDFERLDGYLFLGRGQPAEMIANEHEAALRISFPGLERLARAPVSSFDTGPCLRFPHQAMFHPMRYMAGLFEAVRRGGGRVYGGTQVLRVERGQRPVVWTQSGLQVSANAVIVATNTPINDRFAIHTKQAPYRTYVVALSVPAGSVPPGLYWDTEDPYHYVRLQRGSHADGSGRDLLIVGGEDHKTGEADDADERYARLEAWTRERFTMAGEVRYRWSGQVMEPIDGLGFIGEDPEHARHVYIATGDSGQGMTHGTIAGMLLGDLIAGRSNPWAELYSPRRKTLKAAGEFARENLKVALHYAEWLGRSPVKSADEVPQGKGAIVQRGLHKVAVYRDEEGKVHECSAVCPHLGGLVHWNSEEKAWHCPLHGSRFSPTGEVLGGPAAQPLGPAPASADEQADPVRKAS